MIFLGLEYGRVPALATNKGQEISRIHRHPPIQEPNEGLCGQGSGEQPIFSGHVQVFFSSLHSEAGVCFTPPPVEHYYVYIAPGVQTKALGCMED